MVGQEDLLAVEEDLDRTPGPAREERGDHLVRERIRLAAEGAADHRADDADPVHLHPHHLGQRAMQVVRHLGRRPDVEAAVGVVVRDRAVRLGEGVVDADEAELPPAYVRRVAEGGADVAEVLLDHLLDVGAVERLLMDGIGRRLHPVLDREDGGKFRVLDVDEPERGERRLLVLGRYPGDAVPDIAHAVDGERRLILGDGEDAEAAVGLAAGDDGADAGERRGARRIDAGDAAVGDRAPEDLPDEHSRELEIIRVDRLAAHLPARIHERHRAADHLRALVVEVRVEWARIGHLISPWPERWRARPPRRGEWPR